ncbi:MAG: ABC transporter ATP-binding protein [Stutzerimonas stutzeri]|nr:MAG: ABC transporter ATP-binding protein [Stutzerimonas stutzeri]
MHKGPILEARNVTRTFQIGGGLLGGSKTLRAVSDVNLSVMPGEILALVGESGSGKTTLARMLLGLLAPSSGELLFDGSPLAALQRSAIARRVQPIFQDPYSSLNPRKTIESIISLPLRVHGIGDASTRQATVREMIERVGLPDRVLNAFPNQLSGGQRQRVAIARALVMKPELVICDEPTSALDVSVQSQILNLLQDLQHELGLTYVLITHNLAVVEHIATRVSVMYLGRIVEDAETRSFFTAPGHPYSKKLLSSVLTPEPGLGLPDDKAEAGFSNAIDLPTGCAFYQRCAERLARCQTVAPVASPRNGGRVECHLFQ